MTGPVGHALSLSDLNGKSVSGKGAAGAAEGETAAFSEAIRDVSSHRDDKGQKHRAPAPGEQPADEGLDLQVSQAKRAGPSGDTRVMDFFLHMSSAMTDGVLGDAVTTVTAGDDFSLAAKRVADVIGRRIDTMTDEASRPDGAEPAGPSEYAAAIDGRVIEQILASQPSPQVLQAALSSGDMAAVTSPRGVFAHARLTQVPEEPAVTAKQAGEADDLFRFARPASSDASLPGNLTDGRLREMLDPQLQRAPVQAEEATLAKRTTAGGPQAAALDLPAIDRQTLAGVDIVETRKYLGVATSQTAVASVMSAVTENAEFNSMLRSAGATAATTLNAAKNASNSLKIQLSPPELGTVDATFRMSGGHLTIELKVQTIEAYRQLSDDHSGLLKALRGQGYDVEQVVVHHLSADRVAATSQTGAAPQTGSQPGQSGGQPGQMAGGSGGAPDQDARSGQDGDRRQHSGGQGESERGTHQHRHHSGGIYL